MFVKIYVLSENTALNESFQAEHGLSLYIETAAHKILFDTGASPAFAHNAKLLGIDLSAVDFAVISHGHNDHGGGLHTFMELNATAPIYISSQGFGTYFSGTERNISLDPALQSSGRFILVDKELDLAPNMKLLSCNDCTAKHFADSFGLNKVVNGEFLPDDFRHEQYLIIEENGKRIVFSGCSHKGILNITEWLQPDVLIGGFHFMKLTTSGEDSSILDEAATALNATGATYYTCHCTGVEQYQYLQSKMPRLHYLSAGCVIEV